MQSLAIAMCTLLGLGMLLFGSDYLDRRLLSRAGHAGAGARRDPAAAVTAALTPVPLASAPRSAARPAASVGVSSSAVGATADEGYEPARPAPAFASAAAPAPA
jgi:hypothetical protein